MDLVYILAVLVVFSLILYTVNTFVSIDARLKNLFNIIALVLLVVWLFWYSGLFYHHSIIIR